MLPIPPFRGTISTTVDMKSLLGFAFLNAKAFLVLTPLPLTLSVAETLVGLGKLQPASPVGKNGWEIS